MMFAGFGQWRVVWRQRGTALLRKRGMALDASSPSGTAAAANALPRTTQPSPELGNLPTDYCLPRGWVWGADGVKDTSADATALDQMEPAIDALRASEAPTPEHLRNAGAI